MFNKDTELFPSTRSSYFLSHCAVSPLYRDAAHAMHEFNEKMAHLGLTALDSFAALLPRYRRGFGTLLKTEAGNISYTHTTAEAMNQIAWGIRLPRVIESSATGMNIQATTIPGCCSTSAA
jgi:cysteine desulfurase/selenocysteine lyase